MREQGLLPGMDVDLWDFPESRVIATSDGWNPTLKYQLVVQDVHLERMLSELRRADRFSWDTETSGLKPELGARIAGHCFAARTGEQELTGWYLPIRHIGAHNVNAQQLPVELVTDRLQALFAKGGEVSTFHGKFELKMARADGIEVTRPLTDVAIDATAFNENEPRFALKALAEKYCTPDAKDEQKELDDWMRKDARSLGMVFKKYSKKQRVALRARGLDELTNPTYMERFGFARTPIKLCGRYGIHDGFYTWWLSHVKYAHVRKKYPALWAREHAVMRMMFGMEWRGLPADEACIRDTHERTKLAVEYWLERCHELAPGLLDEHFEGTEAELRQLYYVDLKMKPPKFTSKSEQASVDRDARKLLEKKYPQNAELLNAVGSLATVLKLHSTYAGSYLRHYSPVTKSIHPSYNQLERRERGVPVTGRMSSADPNNQNVKGETLHLWSCGCEECRLGVEKGELSALGRVWGVTNTVSVRRYFTVPEGFVRVYLDFSQIELCILAWFCQDPNLLHAYRTGLDVHQMVADALGILRKIAKQVNFGNSYGMSEFGLATRLPGYYDNPEEIIAYAKEILEAYFKQYPRILSFRKEFATLMRRNGNRFINPLGRPRDIPAISASGGDFWMRKRAERMMMSSIVSGTAADLMKESMRRTVPLAEAFGGCLRQTIHDELVFDLPRQSGWSQVVLQMVRAMEDWPMFTADRPNLSEFSPGRYGVPIKTSVELSVTTWEEKRPIEVIDGNSFRWAA